MLNIEGVHGAADSLGCGEHSASAELLGYANLTVSVYHRHQLEQSCLPGGDQGSPAMHVPTGSSLASGLCAVRIASQTIIWDLARCTNAGITSHAKYAPL